VTYGIIINQDNGSVFDGTTAAAQLIDIALLANGSSGTLTYSNFVGYTLIVGKTNVSKPILNHHVTSITYPSGVPTISYNPPSSNGAATELLVFAQ
jgi:hypothetical protein